MGIVTKSATEATIWKYLCSHLGNACGAAGLMGNLYAESALRSDNLQNTYEKKLGYTDAEYVKVVDSGSYTNFAKDCAGFGLAQWSYWSRKQNLLNFAKGKGKSIGDLSMQLDFLLQELKTSYSAVYNTLVSAQSVKEASDAVLLQFERPADQSAAAQNRRAAYGQAYYDAYADSLHADLAVLVQKGVISTPAYWLQTAPRVQYLPELIHNMAVKLR